MLLPGPVTHPQTSDTSVGLGAEYRNTSFSIVDAVVTARPRGK